MLRIQYASDLHLESADNTRYLEEHPMEVTGDVLVLAGDIAVLGPEYARHPFWDWASDNYRRVIVIPGNCEFHGGFDLAKMHEGWTLKVRSNVTCHYNDVLTIDDTELILTPMWAHIGIENVVPAQAGVSDFRRIRYGDRLMTWMDFNEMHYRCFHFLNDNIRRSTAAHIVVVTHYLPSFRLLSPEFSGNPLNGAFATDLDGFIASGPVEYWLYGHSHRNIDCRIGRTRCFSNQLGYVHMNEHHGFDPAKSILL